MKSTLIRHDKVTDELGNTVEIKLWKVPQTPDKPKGYKYSLVYIVEGKRVIGYGNSLMIFWLMWKNLRGTHDENKKDQNRV